MSTEMTREDYAALSEEERMRAAAGALVAVAAMQEQVDVAGHDADAVDLLLIRERRRMALAFKTLGKTRSIMSKKRAARLSGSTFGSKTRA